MNFALSVVLAFGVMFGLCHADTCSKFSCYHRSTNMMTWHHAASYCSNQGWKLASIHSKQENDFISSRLCPNTNCWIGLNDITHEHKWEWVDGSKVTYTNWYYGEPNNFRNEDAVHMMSLNHQSKWNDLTTNYALPAICKYASPTSDPTGQPTPIPTPIPTQNPTRPPTTLPTSTPTCKAPSTYDVLRDLRDSIDMILEKFNSSCSDP